MYDKRLIEQTINKMGKIIDNYEKLIFDKVGEIENPQYMSQDVQPSCPRVSAPELGCI